MNQNTPLTEQTILVPAVVLSDADRAQNFLVPKLISFGDMICYKSASEGITVTGVFERYTVTESKQLGAVIKEPAGRERIVPVSRLLRPQTATSHAQSGHSVLFQVRIPPNNKSGEPYRIAILKSIWFPIGMDQSDMSNLWVNVDVANFSTTLTGHMNDNTIEENYSMPVILSLNVETLK